MDKLFRSFNEMNEQKLESHAKEIVMRRRIKEFDALRSELSTTKQFGIID